MRVLAAADFHGDSDIYTWLVRCAEETAPDAVVLAGDLLAARPDHPGPIEEAHRESAATILDLLRRIKAPVLYVMGNDDMVDLDSRADTIRSVHGRRVELNGFNVVGYQFSLPFMGGIHEKPEEAIRSDLVELAPLIDERTVFVTHSPAWGILDLGLLDRHAGSRAILEVVENRKPRVHVHGHIHAQFGSHGKHFNVAAAGRQRAVLFDLSRTAHRVLQLGPR